MLFDEEQITVTVTATLVSILSLTTIRPNDGSFSNKTGLYPNPVRDKFMVTLDRSYPKISGIIINMKGVVVKRLSPGNINSGEFEIGVSDLSAGTYVMKLYTGTKEWIFKFVKL